MTFRVPANPDGSFNLEAQQTLAKEYTAILDAISETKASMEGVVDLKPRAELPATASDLGDYSDLEEAKVAQIRLDEIKRSPQKLVQGERLRKRLARIVH